MAKQTKRKYSNSEIGALADAFNKSIFTIQRWIKSDSDMLTSKKAEATLLKINATNSQSTKAS